MSSLLLSSLSLSDARIGLMTRLGILPEYTDNWSTARPAKAEVVDAVLASFGFPCTSEAEARESVFRFDTALWSAPLEPVYALRAGPAGTAAAQLQIRVPSWAGAVEWSLKGDQLDLRGNASVDSLVQLEQHQLGTATYDRRQLVLPDLPPGYYDVALTSWSGTSAPIPEGGATSRLIVSPTHCYLPPQIIDGGKLLGVSSLLAGLRSQSNWGRGNLGDAQELAQILAEYGVQFFGLGPMSAIEPDGKGMQSPFNSNSRHASNIRAINLTAAMIRLGLQDSLGEVSRGEIPLQLEAYRIADVIADALVDLLILAQLERMWEEFKRRHLAEGSQLAVAFRAAVEERGQILHDYATYAALREHHMKADPYNGWHWKNWHPGYQSPTASGITAFRGTSYERIRFYEFVEWLVRTDLLELRRISREAGMGVGPYVNLAFASSVGGADSWIHGSLYMPGLRHGVPGDAFEAGGQDWGNPVINPHELRARGAESEIDMVRYWMSAAGGIETDHGCGLYRQFVIPDGFTPNDGVYLLQPQDLHLAILALESHRHECVVIAETLGTVPAEQLTTLADWRVLSYHVQRWEKVDDRMRRPAEYPKWGCAISSNFNMEPLRGFWLGWYLTFRRLRSMDASLADSEKAANDRQVERRLLLDLLLAEGLIGRELCDELLRLVPPFTAELSPTALEDLNAIQIPDEFLIAVVRCLARSESVLVSLDLCELMHSIRMQNIPGTDRDRWPNWLVIDEFSFEDLADDERLRKIFEAVHAERSRK